MNDYALFYLACAVTGALCGIGLLTTQQSFTDWRQRRRVKHAQRRIAILQGEMDAERRLRMISQIGGRR